MNMQCPERARICSVQNEHKSAVSRTSTNLQCPERARICSVQNEQESSVSSASTNLQCPERARICSVQNEQESSVSSASTNLQCPVRARICSVYVILLTVISIECMISHPPIHHRLMCFHVFCYSYLISTRTYPMKRTVRWHQTTGI